MRLRPRAVSSDRDEARAIAQRLARGPSGAAEAPPAVSRYVSLGAGSVPAVPPPAPLAPPEVSAREASEEEPVAPPVAEEPPLPPDNEPASAADALLGTAGEATEFQPPAEATEAAEAEPSAPPLVEEESPLAGLEAALPSEPAPEPPPTWETLLSSVQALADAQAAMLIGPDKALVASSGDWPAVGAEAIARKLGPVVIPRLAAPGSIVPVKLGGQVLTAWRIEVEGQALTLAFLAGQAIGADSRPAIDEQIVRGSLRP